MGEAAESNKITETQEKLAQGLALGESPSADTNALVVSGYRSGNLNEVIASPQVARAVKAGLVRRLIAEAAPLSMGLLIKVVKQGHKIADAGDSPTNTQTDAAKALMQMAGMQAAGESLSIEKDPGEMSGAELEEALRKAKDFEAEAARRGAIEVVGTVSAPSDAPVDSQAIDAKDSLFS